MARIMVIGAVAEVELESDPVEGGVVAKCTEHKAWVFGNIPAHPDGCPWTETYDDWGDATEYSQDHADNGK
jgi:hypothetical protein